MNKSTLGALPARALVTVILQLAVKIPFLSNGYHSGTDYRKTILTRPLKSRMAGVLPPRHPQAFIAILFIIMA